MIRFRILLLLGLILGPAGGALAAPKVVASIQPVHSLVANVMAGVGEPALLIRGTASEHAYALRPSDARLIEQADIVFWVGPDLEGHLRKPIAALGGGARLVTLATEAGLVLLHRRAAGAWEEEHPSDHDHDDGPQGGDRAAAHGAYDMHVWLDPENAQRIVAKAAEVLSAADAANAPRYAANAERTLQALAALDAELRAALAPVQGVPFVVFHDAYHYFEHRYGLAAVGSVMLDPERPPGARRLYAIRAKLVETGARCVFSEPQYDAGLVRTLVEGTPARAAQLDPLGAALPPGPDAYFALLRRLAADLIGCLRAAP